MEEPMAVREEGTQLQERQHSREGKRFVPFEVSTELPRPAWVIFIL